MEWRARALEQLSAERFHVLVIGGGATGAGIALDAVARGLRVALVEGRDFAEGTSSRSTKLLHGGVRYLEAAVKTFDTGQLRLVRSALHERRTLLRIAPHLTRRLPLLTPLYRWWEAPYYFTGLKLYDLLAGSKFRIGASSFVPPRRTLELLPGLRSEGLKGAVQYFDGQFDDARMVLAIVRAASERGAVVLNHAPVNALLKAGGRVTGAGVTDALTGQAFEVDAQVVINATGPQADAVLHMDDPGAEPILTISSGAHIVLSRTHLPNGTGMLVPRTDDGRVIFMLPWQGHTLVGTTDNPSVPHDDPQATEDEIAYLLEYVGRYFDARPSRGHVLAAWSGLRPLLRPRRKGAGGTASITRDHLIEASDSGLITITGGKWTTYRHMAEECVDFAVNTAGLPTRRPSETATIPLAGGAGWNGGGEKRLTEGFGLAPDVALHLHHAYGSHATAVAELAATTGLRERLHPAHPYLEAEVPYAMMHEFAADADDVLKRRMRLGFLDEPAYSASLAAAEDLVALTLSGVGRGGRGA